MSDEYKEIAENTENGGSKKKKIIIGVVIAVVVCAVIAVVCALTFGGNEKDYTDTPVNPETTSELTPGIENGVFVGGNDAAQSGSEDGGSDSQQSAGGSGSGGSSSSGSQSGGSGSAGGSGSSGNSSSSGGSGSSGNSGNSGSQGESDSPRQVQISITLPNDGNTADKLFIYVNGKLVNDEGVDCTLNGSTFTFITSESYEGVVTVEARLQNYGTSAKQTSTETGSSVSFSLPLDSSEENYASNI